MLLCCCVVFGYVGWDRTPTRSHAVPGGSATLSVSHELADLLQAEKVATDERDGRVVPYLPVGPPAYSRQTTPPNNLLRSRSFVPKGP